jgi:CMP-N-acetylneuraminic acid synthetase
MTDDVLAIVPARSGSRGLPDKNIKPLCGKPLLGWSVAQAVASDAVDRVIVSTDSEEYADIAAEFGADVPFIRPAELARDETPIGDVISHHLDWLADHGETYEYVTLIEPTSPLRCDDDIDNAVTKLSDNSDRADSLVSVQELEEEYHPYMVKTVDGGLLSPFVDHDEDIYQRQQLPTFYQPEGTVYVSKTATFNSDDAFYQDHTLAYVIDRWQSPEIDDIFDFVTVEAIMNHQQEQVAMYEQLV